jgi:hypothetical protein
VPSKIPLAAQKCAKVKQNAARAALAAAGLELLYLPRFHHWSAMKKLCSIGY